MLVELGSHDMKLGNGTYLTEVKARIFDLGVISLILRIHFEDDVTFDEYMDMSIVSENMPEDEIRSYLDAVLETIRPACSNERVSDFELGYCAAALKGPHTRQRGNPCGNTQQPFCLRRRRLLSGVGFRRCV